MTPKSQSHTSKRVPSSKLLAWEVKIWCKVLPQTFAAVVRLVCHWYQI